MMGSGGWGPRGEGEKGRGEGEKGEEGGGEIGRKSGICDEVGLGRK